MNRKKFFKIVLTKTKRSSTVKNYSGLIVIFGSILKNRKKRSKKAQKRPFWHYKSFIWCCKIFFRSIFLLVLSSEVNLTIWLVGKSFFGQYRSENCSKTTKFLKRDEKKWFFVIYQWKNSIVSVTLAGTFLKNIILTFGNY